ncbi:hypothetical protein [Sphingomonas limnosediminicola]|uniref:hypothetical protein n=1 Tax=Sphingomonas limnosediminicola TaxID=940133 RepID=UPI0031E281A6
MKRIKPLFLIIAALALVVGGIVLKTITAEGCVGHGGVVAGPMSRSQYCVNR